MLSYSDYKKRLVEADEPAPVTGAAPGGPPPTGSPPGLPDPSTGMPPMGGGASAPPSIGGDMGGMGDPSMDMGGGAPTDPNQKPTALNIKTANFFDALDKLLKKIEKGQ